MIKLAADNDVELSAEEADSLFTARIRTLSDDELDTITGGNNWNENETKVRYSDLKKK